MSFPAYVVSIIAAWLVTHYFGYQILTQIGFPHPGPVVYAFFGLFAFLLASVTVWPIVRNLFNATRTQLGNQWRSASGKNRVTRHLAPLPLDEISRQVQTGYNVEYKGLVDRDFHYNENGRRRRRVRLAFSVWRNSIAMTRPERNAVVIMRVLDQYGLLPGRQVERALFCLAWGDSGGVLDIASITLPGALTRDNGLKTGGDFVRHEAQARNINFAALNSELLSNLQSAARQPDAHEDVKRLYQENIHGD